MVASSRRGLLGRVFAGDSVHDLLRQAPCPVAIAPVGHTNTGRLETVTVGFDGSHAAEHAFLEVVRLGERDAAAVPVVDLVEPCVATAAMTGGCVGNALDDAYARARETLARVVEQHHVRGVIATGRAARELRAASRNADLSRSGSHITACYIAC